MFCLWYCLLLVQKIADLLKLLKLAGDFFGGFRLKKCYLEVMVEDAVRVNFWADKDNVASFEKPAQIILLLVISSPTYNLFDCRVLQYSIQI